MSKFWDISFGVSLFIVSIILWLYVLLISSDFSMNISKDEFIISLISLFLFGLLYSFYIKRSKIKEVGNLLLIPLLFWLSDVINAIKYNYQACNTIISVIGFVITGYCIVLSTYQLMARRKKV